MTIAEVLKKAQSLRLRTEMELFLSNLLSCDRLDLLAYSEREIPVNKLAKLHMAWRKIRKGMPVAYLIKSKEFYGLDFYVDSRVLVPRASTETLIDLAKNIACKNMKVLEVGTGSGVIAIALKHERPDLLITASDISLDALEVAKKNAKRHKTDISFFQSDLLSDIPQDDYEILLANLPYIGKIKHNFISDNVEAYEPHIALFGGEDGLFLYSELLNQAKDYSFKYIIGEIGFSQGEDIKALASEILPSYTFELHQDYEGLDRIFILCYNDGA